jgi:NAD(P)-dependent dehydrogenase (short-subunit alcohol dehydrogenase family)
MDKSGRIVGISSPGKNRESATCVYYILIRLTSYLSGCNVNSPPRPGYLLPGSGKVLMEYYMRQYARTLAPQGITVNVVVPGHVLTTAWGPAFKNGREGLLEWIKQRSPMGRPIEVEEVSNTIAFLSSLEASAITGQAILCDGGLSNFTA